LEALVEQQAKNGSDEDSFPLPIRYSDVSMVMMLMSNPSFVKVFSIRMVG